MKVQVVIPAGGLGQRLGKSMPKALVPVSGVPLLIRTLQRFDALGLARNAIVAIPASHREAFLSVLEEDYPEIRLVDGGEARQDSVRLGIAALDPDTEICVIHDAARLFITPEAIHAAIDAALAMGAATVAIPSIDTILIEDGEGYLKETPDRRQLWACQTPQVFRTEIIRSAHERAVTENMEVTDDATLVRRCGHAVKLIHGSPLNFKLTTPTDLQIAEALIEKGMECA
ncbi:MAG: 2-C-methyl-D-erythritol 4-phosphate cytidylyltransferase [Candidatus Hydrogenedentes bacterium]|nr:2-C-methyl-D-erythritol 4-phosphate cytidylyltransferase [Candidatus Hydrogenedentota bacterium]